MPSHFTRQPWRSASDLTRNELAVEVRRLQAENRNLTRALGWSQPQGETRHIHLDQGEIALVDAADFVALARWRWLVMGTPRGPRYAYRMVEADGQRFTVRMHREILGLPDGVIVDHINRNGLDNRRVNLRPANAFQNAVNSPLLRRNNHSGFRGVRWNKNAHKWHAQIGHLRRNYHIGYFDSARDAAAAYNARAVELFGEFAVLNDLTLAADG